MNKKSGKNIFHMLLKYSGLENDNQAIDFMNTVDQVIPEEKLFHYKLVSSTNIYVFKITFLHHKLLLMFIFCKSKGFYIDSRVIFYSQRGQQILINDTYRGFIPRNNFLKEYNCDNNSQGNIEKLNEICNCLVLLKNENPIELLHYFSQLERPQHQSLGQMLLQNSLITSGY